MEIGQNVYYNRVVWYDGNVDSPDNEVNREILELKFGKDGVFVTADEDECLKAIKNSIKATLIISGSCGQILIPKITQLAPMKSLVGAIVFCSDVETHKSWQQNYTTVAPHIVDYFPKAMEHAGKIMLQAMTQE